MEKDRELDRKLARNWREYLDDSLEVIKLLKWLWINLISDEGKKRARIMTALMFVASLTAVAQPWSLSLVFNGLATKSTLVIVGLGLFWLFTCVSQLLYRGQMHHREYLLGDCMKELDRFTTEKFFEKSLGVHINEGNELSDANIKKGYERIHQMQGLLLFEGADVIMGLLLSFLALWFLDFTSALMATGMMLMHLVWSLFLNRKVLVTCTPFDKKWRALNRYRVERWEKVEKIKTFAKEDEELCEIASQFEEVIEPDRNFWLWFIVQISWRGILTYSILAAILVHGAYQVWQGNMTIGLLYPLAAWSSQLANNLWRISHVEQMLNFMAPSVIGLKEALELPIGITHSRSPKRLKENPSCRVEFKNMGFFYPAQKDSPGTNKQPTRILNQVSFSVKPGEKVALIGGSGAGKTTIMRLLLRYMDPTEGQVLIDGHDIKNLDLSSWLNNVGYVAQQPQILDGTIRYNLLYGLPKEIRASVTDKRLWELMRLLQIDFGDRLTHGLETKVGKNGIRLSGGEGQRLMIGTAILKNPRFLVIDEATSNLDATTEKLVQTGLQKLLTRDRGALIITHRLNTVRRMCDKFILLSRNGQGSEVMAVVERFEELAEISSEFVELARNQGIEFSKEKGG